MMGSHIVVLNNSDMATDLLERRSVISGDRVCSYRPSDIPFTTSALTDTYYQPRLPMANELYVFSYSSVVTDTRRLIQDGVHLGNLPHALREYLAHSPQVIPPFL